LTKANFTISTPFGDFTNQLPVINGRGRYLDNTFIEWPWRSLKQEPVYLYEIIDGFQTKQIMKA